MSQLMQFLFRVTQLSQNLLPTHAINDGINTSHKSSVQNSCIIQHIINVVIVTLQVIIIIIIA